MPGVTREQIDRAKEWDLLSYLQTYEPGELTKKRPTDKEYRTKTHDSLVISNGRWNWTTRVFGGKTYKINDRIKGLVRMVEQDIFLADLLKEIAIHIKPLRRLWDVRFFFQVIKAVHTIHFHWRFFNWRSISIKRSAASSSSIVRSAFRMTRYGVASNTL